MIHPIGLFKLAINLRHYASLKPLFLTQKMFRVENLIIVSLNTVIAIIVIVLLDVSMNGLFIAIQCLFLFHVVFQVMHTAY